MTESDNHTLPLTAEESAPANRAEENSAAGSKEEARLRELAANYEARFDEVAELITRVRHEINNPLTGVLGQAQLLMREELSERARKRVATIEEMAIRIRDIVAELRQIQKPSKG